MTAGDGAAGASVGEKMRGSPGAGSPFTSIVTSFLVGADMSAVPAPWVFILIV